MEYVSILESRLNFILSELGWNISSFRSKNDESLVSCPYNDDHRMPQSSLSDHVVRCTFACERHGRSDTPLTGTSSSLTLTNDLQESILREAGLEVQTECTNLRKPTLTQCQRLAIYDFIVAKTKPEPKLNNRQDSHCLMVSEKEEEKREMTGAELAAAQRDAKRRRATYRNNIHTKNKSHVEVMREVIESQMNTLSEGVPEKDNRPSSADRLGEPRHGDSSSTSRLYHNDSFSKRSGHKREAEKSCVSSERHFTCYSDDKTSKCSHSHHSRGYRSNSRKRLKEKDTRHERNRVYDDDDDSTRRSGSESGHSKYYKDVWRVKREKDDRKRMSKKEKEKKKSFSSLC